MNFEFICVFIIVIIKIEFVPTKATMVDDDGSILGVVASNEATLHGF